MLSALTPANARDCDPALRLSRDGHRALLWLDGEQDIATVAALNDALTSVVRADSSDLIVDVSGVTFMSTATIDELIRAREILLAQSRNMTLRSPSSWIRRVLGWCGLGDVVEPAGSPG